MVRGVGRRCGPGPGPGRWGAWLAVALCLAAGPLTGQEAERGFRLMTVFSADDYDAAAQNWTIVQDPRGLVYVGNLHGVLEYDGEQWRLIPIAKESAVFALAVDPNGRIAVGGFDEVGYLAPDEVGRLRYVSLVPHLPPSLRDLGEVQEIHWTPDGFLVFSANQVLLWAPGGEMLAVDTGRDAAGELSSFAVEAEVYVDSATEGLRRWRGGAFEPVAGPVPSPQPLRLLARLADGGFVSYREEVGFERWVEPASPEPFASDASAWVADKGVAHGVRLTDGRVAVATHRGGLLLLTPQGDVSEIVDDTVGLPDEDLVRLHVDADGALWLALHVGVVRLHVESSLAIFDDRIGLRGASSVVSRHAGQVYVGTTDGLFVLRPAPVAETRIGLQAQRVPGVGATWGLASVGGELLVGYRGGLSVLADDGRLEPVAGLEGRTVYMLQPSRFDPDLVFVGMAEGMGFARREGGSWVARGPLPDTRLTRSFWESSADDLWVGTVFDGVLRFRLSPGSDGFPSAEVVGVHLAQRGETTATSVGGSLLVLADGVFRWDETQELMVADGELDAAIGGLEVFHASEDDLGALWFNSRPIRRVSWPTGGGLEVDDHLLVGLPGREVQDFWSEPEGVMWMVNESGAFRYTPGAPGDVRAPRAPLIRSVSSSDLGVLFGGAGEPARPGPVLDASRRRRLRFEFAAGSFEPRVAYQYRLDPIDPSWSEWGPQPAVEFTNLTADDYVLRVRSRGADGRPGPEARYPFRVLAPWYLTTPAGVLWLTIVLGLLVVGFRVRHRGLRRRASDLERRVAEQTEALGHTVERLRLANETVEEKNRQLEEANRRLKALTLHDGLTGIPNRRHLEETLKTEWNRAVRSRLPLAFVLLDLDHFKHLNDTVGHQHGDECLKRLAAFLVDSLRRSGDLAARYGGEEFAVVLPATDLDGAHHFAEGLRAGFEEIGFPHPESATGTVTASFGVASMVPAVGGSRHRLVEAADQALYRAKQGGRNRVEVGAVEE